MKISPAVVGGGAVGPALSLAHILPWFETCVVMAVSAGILIYRLLAESQRRKTLEMTYRHAPPGTVVVLGEGPGGPPMLIRVGGRQRPEPPLSAPVMPCQRQAPSGRR